MLNRYLLVVSTLVVLIAMLAPPAAATVYAVTTNPFTASHSLSSSTEFDSYELVAANGEQVTYTFAVTSGCAGLYFYQGHNVDISTSLYYIAWSTTEGACVMSYSDMFPVEASDGTEFSVVVYNENSQNVQYTLAITIAPAPAIPTWVIGAVIGVIIIVVIIVVVVIVMARRKKPAPTMPTAPPPYQQPAYPGAPPPPPPYPQQPPQQPPPAPPPYGP